jgi:uncharacterized protein
MDVGLAQKYDALIGQLRPLDKLAVAFSGGVDSTLLLRVAHDVLADRALAVTVAAQVHPTAELEEAGRLAANIGARHEILHLDVLELDAFRHNPPDRCYGCKKAVFTEIGRFAAERGIGRVADGTNADDAAADDRPGLRAVAELGVLTPLRDAGLTKDDVRALSRELRLPTADKPAYACLATRFPTGTRITAAELDRVERAEAALHDLGFTDCRVRVHGDLARIEVPPQRVTELAVPEQAGAVADRLEAAGFRYVSLDLRGYRTGSMNAEEPR